MIKRVRIFLSQILVRVSTGPRHPFTNYVLGTMKGQLKVVFEFRVAGSKDRHEIYLRHSVLHFLPYI